MGKQTGIFNAQLQNVLSINPPQKRLQALLNLYKEQIDIEAISASPLIQQIEILLQKHSDPNAEAEFLLLKGKQAYILGAHDESESYLYQALDAFTLTENDDGLLHTYTQLALLLKALGRQSEALITLHQAIHLAHALDDKNSLSQTHSSIAHIHLLFEDYEAAKVSCDKALKLAEDAGNLQRQGVYRSNLGIIYREMQYYNKSLKQLDKAEDLAKKTKHDALLSSVYTEKAKTYYSLAEEDKAFDVIEKALALCLKLDSPKKLSECYYDKALLLFSAKRIADAAQYIQLAYHTLGTIKFPVLEEQIHLLFARILEAQNQYKKAIDHYNISIKLKDDLKKQKVHEARKFSLTSTLQLDNEILSDVYKMACDMTKTRSVKETLVVIHDILAEQIDFQLFGISWMNRIKKNPEYIKLVIDGKEVETGKIPLENKKSLTLWCYEHKHSLILYNALEDHSTFIMKNLTDLKNSRYGLFNAVIFIPLMDGENIKGTLTIQNRQALAYDSSDLFFMEKLSPFISNALNNAFLLEKETSGKKMDS